MIAVDTNVVVRLMALDDGEQCQKARSLFNKSRTYIMTNVIMEAEWVLRTSYNFRREEIAEGFSRMFGLANVTLDQPALVTNALSAFRDGMDLADAIHVLAAESAGLPEFATFDRTLRKRARKVVTSIEVIAP